MVNNINGLTGLQGSATRGREKSPATESATVEGRGKDVAAKVASDQVELSPGARDLQSIEARIKDLPEVNRERVDHIKNQLRDGNYSVDPSRLAAKIAQFEQNI